MTVQPGRRRLLLAAGASGVCAWRPAIAQATRPRIGIVYPGPSLSRPVQPGSALDAFERGLRETGWDDGRNVELIWRGDGSDPRKTARAVTELLAAPVDLLVAGTSAVAAVARAATSSVPIVMAVSADPVADGLVDSLARPGGNVTGMSIMSPELNARRLQLLGELLPGLRRVALLLDLGNPRWPRDLQEHEATAATLGLALVPVRVAGPQALEASVDEAAQAGAEALILMQTPLFVFERERLARLALARRLPSLSGSGDRQFARAGGLMNYGANIATSWYRAAHHVDRILRGARPAEIPVEQPARFELAINLRTATALGLQVPAHLLLLADEVVR